MKPDTFLGILKSQQAEEFEEQELFSYSNSIDPDSYHQPPLWADQFLENRKMHRLMGIFMEDFGISISQVTRTLQKRHLKKFRECAIKLYTNYRLTALELYYVVSQAYPSVNS